MDTMIVPNGNILTNKMLNNLIEEVFQITGQVIHLLLLFLHIVDILRNQDFAEYPRMELKRMI